MIYFILVLVLILFLTVAGWWWVLVVRAGRVRRWRGGVLVDWGTGVVGQPDGYVRVGVGAIAPVEFKSSRRPGLGDRRGRRQSAQAQLWVYCLLLERAGWEVPYGYIVWGGGEQERVAWTVESRRRVLELIARTRQIEARARGGLEVDRDHEERGRCESCFYRGSCEQRLA